MMKFAMFYNGEFEFSDNYNEIIVEIQPLKKLSNIQQFLHKHNHQTVTFKIANPKDFLENGQYDALISNLSKDANIKFMFSEPYDMTTNLLIQKLQELNYPYFFNIFVDDIDLLHFFISKKVSDIYIVNTLGFALADIGPLLHKHNIQIRVFPNVCQSKDKEADPLTSFWIRPNDIPLYEKYVDICEIFCDITDNDKKNAYYRIYGINQDWLGNLNEIIGGLTIDLDNQSVHPLFGTTRIQCNKKCKFGHKCQRCHRIYTLANKMIDADLMFQIEENNNET